MAASSSIVYRGSHQKRRAKRVPGVSGGISTGAIEEACSLFSAWKSPLLYRRNNGIGRVRHAARYTACAGGIAIKLRKSEGVRFSSFRA
jgi:hypothetical protein